MTTANEKWADAQTASIDKGLEISRQASNKGLDYLLDVIDNIKDNQWRKMAVEQRSLEIGVGKGLSEIVVPKILKDMRKNLRRKAKLTQVEVEMLIEIYMGVVVKEIVKELEAKHGRN